MTVGSYEAKTNLPALLERVTKGEEVTITRHGVPIAKLVPVRTGGSHESVAQTIVALKEFRKHHKLGRVSVRTLMNEGRR